MNPDIYSIGRQRTNAGLDNTTSLDNLVKIIAYNNNKIKNCIEKSIFEFQIANTTVKISKTKETGGMYIKILWEYSADNFKVYKSSFHYTAGLSNRIHFKVFDTAKIPPNSYVPLTQHEKQTIYNIFKINGELDQKYFPKNEEVSSNIQFSSPYISPISKYRSITIKAKFKNMNKYNLLTEQDKFFYHLIYNCVESIVSNPSSNTLLSKNEQQKYAETRNKSQTFQQYLPQYQQQQYQQQQYQQQYQQPQYQQPQYQQPYQGGNKNKINLKKLTILELKDICKINKIKKYSKLKKDDLIKLIKNYNKVN